VQGITIPFEGNNAQNPLLGRGRRGADDEIRTRDPHLGKVCRPVQTPRNHPWPAVLVDHRFAWFRRVSRCLAACTRP